MTTWIQAGIAAASLMFAILCYVLSILMRNIRRAIRTEDRIGALESKVITLVTTQQQMQISMLDQMKYDRDATDKRLRYVEEYFMHLGMSKG